MNYRNMIVLIIIFASVIYITSDKTKISSTIKQPALFAQISIDLDKPSAIDISYNFDDESIIGIILSQNGPNKTMNIDKMYLKKINALSSALNSDSSIEVFKSCTDWIGPIMAKDIGFESNDEKQFTGGWHTIKQDNSEFTTARTKEIRVFTDKREVKKSSSGFYNLVEIWVTNEIIGYNNNFSKPWSPLLEETVKYTIEKGVIRVEVEITAIKDATIERYYGLQTQNSPWGNKVSYISSDNQSSEYYDTISDNQSITKSLFEVVESIRVENDQMILLAQIDKNYGIGDFKYLSNDAPYAFTKQYGKSYFNLVSGVEINLITGKSICWRGQYTIINK